MKKFYNTTLDNPFAPDHKQIMRTCKEIFKLTENEDMVLDYLCEVASSDFKCVDVCTNWAVDFYNENEEEIQE